MEQRKNPDFRVPESYHFLRVQIGSVLEGGNWASFGREIRSKFAVYVN